MVAPAVVCWGLRMSLAVPRLSDAAAGEREASARHGCEHGSQFAVEVKRGITRSANSRMLLSIASHDISPIRN